MNVQRTDGKVAVSIPVVVDGKSWNLIFNYISSDEYQLCSIAEKARDSITSELQSQWKDGYECRNRELQAQRRRYRDNAKKKRAKKRHS